MDKKSSLILSFMITFVVLGNFLFFYDFSDGREEVIISEVIDGDTLKLEDGRTVRLLNINTPEKNEKNYQEAKNFLETYVNKSVLIEVEGVGKYGRVLGRVYTPEYLNLEIVERGLAHSYLVGEDELGKFKEAEERSREEGKGIWEKSEYYGCVNVEINKNEEYLVLKLGCDVNLDDWTLKDESTKIYHLHSISFNEVTIYSEKGLDDGEKLYWGQGNVWNNDKDSIFVRDARGFLVFYDSYGY